MKITLTESRQVFPRRGKWLNFDDTNDDWNSTSDNEDYHYYIEDELKSASNYRREETRNGYSSNSFNMTMIITMKKLIVKDRGDEVEGARRHKN